MTDKITDDDDDGRLNFGYTGTSKNCSVLKKRSLDNEIPRKKKFSRPDANTTLIDHQKGVCANEIPAIMHEEQVEIRVDDAVTLVDPHDVRCDGQCLLWNKQLLQGGIYPGDLKICFPTFDDTYGNCNLDRTDFENRTIVSPDAAFQRKGALAFRMLTTKVKKPEQMLPDGSNRMLTQLEQSSLKLLVAQCYLDPNISSTEAAFVSTVPFVCEAYRCPLFNLTQEQFYKRVVQTFEAHPKRDTLPWNSTQAILDVALPTYLCRYYP
jgi:hypothetical protein